MEIATDFVIQQFYTYCKRPTYKKTQGVYNAECPICKEGTSSGTKRRLFYFPDEHYFYCFNCSRSWSEFNWLKEVTGDTSSSILKNAKTHVVDLNNILNTEDVSCNTLVVEELPRNSFDIMNKQDVEFLKSRYPDKHRVIDLALSHCHKRRLLTAINKPKSLYLSLQDKYHCNRLIIPFFDEWGKLYTYQSRSLTTNTYPKYITKIGDKCLFGENTIDNNFPYIFVLEGPIDAMFIKNGVAVGGSTISERQAHFLHKHFDKQIIYIFDNDKENTEMQKNVLKHISDNKSVFIWPKSLSNFKDVNEVCCHFNLNYIDPKFIIQNTFIGLEAKVRFLTKRN